MTTVNEERRNRERLHGWSLRQAEASKACGVRLKLFAQNGQGDIDSELRFKTSETRTGTLSAFDMNNPSFRLDGFFLLRSSMRL